LLSAQTAAALDAARAQMFDSHALVRGAACAADNSRALPMQAPVNNEDAEASEYLIDPNGVVEGRPQAVWLPSGHRLVRSGPRAVKDEVTRDSTSGTAGGTHPLRGTVFIWRSEESRLRARHVPILDGMSTFIIR